MSDMPQVMYSFFNEYDFSGKTIIPFNSANKAYMLNVVLLGKTANQLLVLSNLESYNAVLINQGKNQKERMELLCQLAIQQLRTLETVNLNSLPSLSVALQKK